jgi:RNA polymerase sigma factor (sigma-70 family)
LEPREDENLSLLRAARQGDRDAIDGMLKPLYPRLFSFICRYVGSNALAEDVFQESVLRIVQNLKTFVPGNFDAWTFTIARNCCNDFFRRNPTTASLDAPGGEDRDFALKDIVAAAGTFPEAELDRKIEEARLKQALANLPAEQREVVLLRIYGGFSFKEIAKMTECPLNTALGRMHYALKALQKELAEEKTAPAFRWPGRADSSQENGNELR